jgi:hypothetical protein
MCNSIISYNKVTPNVCVNGGQIKVKDIFKPESSPIKLKKEYYQNEIQKENTVTYIKNMRENFIEEGIFVCRNFAVLSCLGLTFNKYNNADQISKAILSTTKTINLQDAYAQIDQYAAINIWLMDQAYVFKTVCLCNFSISRGKSKKIK